LSTNTERDFERLFKEHFKSLYAYAYTILKDEIMAEEIVQQVFFKIWDRQSLAAIETSVKAYLYKSVYHDSLNYLKHQKIKNQYEAYAMHQNKHQSENTSGIGLKELENRLRKAMNDLPQQCRTIFQLSRFEGLKYQEIANQLNISVKTVENQMGKALKQLRTKLVDFLPLFILLLFQR
jgi:RNA polymerase sigma-70 factor, ECF subfamily